MDFPYYRVLEYPVQTFDEARQLAPVLAERYQRRVHIMQKCDQHSLFHSLMVFDETGAVSSIQS